MEDEISLEFSTAHEKLLRCARLYWVGVERGAPGISFGGIDSAVEEELCDFEVGEDEDLDKEVLEAARLAIEEADGQAPTEDLNSAVGSLAQALEIMLDHGKIKPGIYNCQESEIDTFLLEVLEVDLKSRFELTNEHIALIRILSVREGVLPYIDPKRPYGSMTYFELDMAAALGMPLPENGAKFPEEEEQHLHKLHFEMLPALHVFLRNAKIDRGIFKFNRQDWVWERI